MKNDFIGSPAFLFLCFFVFSLTLRYCFDILFMKEVVISSPLRLERWVKTILSVPRSFNPLPRDCEGFFASCLACIDISVVFKYNVIVGFMYELSFGQSYDGSLTCRRSAFFFFDFIIFFSLTLLSVCDKVLLARATLSTSRLMLTECLALLSLFFCY